MTARRRAPAGRRVTPAAASARIWVSGARAAYIGPALALAPHRNAAATVAVALGPPFSLALGDAAAIGTYTTRRIALIPPGTRHHLVASGDMAFVYLDALSDDHRHIRDADLDAARERLTALVADTHAPGNACALCTALGVPARGAADPRIASVVRRMDVRPQAFDTIETAAASVAMSASRFRALFRVALGMPFRRYRLWRRMAVALEAVAAGVSFTTAAHDSGFASSAHLSAAFREMFGIAPSRLFDAGVRFERDEAGARGPLSG